MILSNQLSPYLIKVNLTRRVNDLSLVDDTFKDVVLTTDTTNTIKLVNGNRYYEIVIDSDKMFIKVNAYEDGKDNGLTYNTIYVPDSDSDYDFENRFASTFINKTVVRMREVQQHYKPSLLGAFIVQSYTRLYNTL